MANELSFLELAREKPEVVERAVKAERSPYQVLRALGYGGQSVRARQLCEAVTHFEWDTSHWVKPVQATEVQRDFSAGLLEKRGDQGLAYEQKCYNIMDVSELAREARVYREYELSEWQPVDLETPPWDAAIVNAVTKQAVVFEFKVSLRGSATLRKQLSKRAEWVDEVRKAGWQVDVGAVVGTRKLEDNKLWVKNLRNENIIVSDLSTFELTLSELVDAWENQ